MRATTGLVRVVTPAYSSLMPIRLFLKIEGIKGESTDAVRTDEIEVDSYSWGVNQTASIAGGGGAGAGKPTFVDVSFTAAQSVASPHLFLACVEGTHLQEAVLTMRTSGKRPVDRSVVSFFDIIISSFHQHGMADDDHGTDSFSLTFATIRIESTRKDGTATPVTAGWDVRANKQL